MVRNKMTISKKHTSSLIPPTRSNLSISTNLGRTRLVGMFSIFGILGSLLVLTVLPGLLIFFLPGQIYLAGKAYDGLTCGQDPVPYCPSCPMSKPVRDLESLTTEREHSGIEHRGHYPYTT
ncbi:MAG: hypothetical protein ACFFCP_03340 [Promethearchaeota archaeon]